MSSFDVEAFGDWLAELVAEKLDARQRARKAAGWLSQNDVPIGARKFIALARKRQQRGEPGVAQFGRRWLMAPEAWEEECSRAGGRKTRAARAEKAASDPVDELKRELSLVRGAR